MSCLIHIVSEQYGSQKNPALLKQEPDRTFYISFDVEDKLNPHYHNALHYSYTDMEMIQMEQQSVTIDNIAFQVVVVLLLLDSRGLYHISNIFALIRNNMYFLAYNFPDINRTRTRQTIV